METRCPWGLPANQHLLWRLPESISHQQWGILASLSHPTGLSKEVLNLLTKLGIFILILSQAQG